MIMLNGASKTQGGQASQPSGTELSWPFLMRGLASSSLPNPGSSDPIPRRNMKTRLVKGHMRCGLAWIDSADS